MGRKSLFQIQQSLLFNLWTQISILNLSLRSTVHQLFELYKEVVVEPKGEAEVSLHQLCFYIVLIFCMWTKLESIFF